MQEKNTVETLLETLTDLEKLIDEVDYENASKEKLMELMYVKKSMDYCDKMLSNSLNRENVEELIELRKIIKDQKEKSLKLKEDAKEEI